VADLIQTTVVGRLTRDAELKEVGSGNVCNFRLAATPYKAESLFFDVAIWGKRGEALHQYLGKGQQVVVIGDLTTREYEASGEKRTALKINAQSVALVGGRSERADAGDEGGSGDGDDLPF
jgi:single-strand DNA-binding protein